MSDPQQDLSAQFTLWGSPDQSIHLPDYGEPVTTMPSLEYDNFSEFAVSFDYHTALAPDPQTPDLEDYGHPYGLSVYNIDRAEMLQLAVQPAQLEMPDDLVVQGEIEALDTQLPEPLYEPQRQMLERPGELDASALEQLHLSPMYQQLTDVLYDDVFMDQSGMNSTRRRHMDLLMRGLDAEER